MKERLVGIILILLIIMPGCEKDNNNDQHLGVDYEIAVNESFTIELISNPSTGYMWAWTNSAFITTVDTFDREFVPDTPIREGGGGKEVWNFRGIKRGTDSLIMEYCRSWEPNSTIDSTVIYVKVDWQQASLSHRMNQLTDACRQVPQAFFYCRDNS